MKRVLKELSPYKLHIVLSMLLAAVAVVCTLLVPIYIGQAVDTMAGVGASAKAEVDFAALYVILRKMLAVIFGTALSQFFMSRVNNYICYKLTLDLRERAFQKTLYIPLKKMDAASQGDYVSRIITDADSFSDGMLLRFNQFFTGVMTIVGTIVFMMKINVTIALVVVALTPLSFLFAKFSKGIVSPVKSSIIFTNSK